MNESNSLAPPSRSPTGSDAIKNGAQLNAGGALPSSPSTTASTESGTAPSTESSMPPFTESSAPTTQTKSGTTAAGGDSETAASQAPDAHLQSAVREAHPPQITSGSPSVRPSDQPPPGKPCKINLLVQSCRKSKTKEERDLAKGGKAGNPGRFKGEMEAFLESQRSLYESIRERDEGKNKVLSNFW